MSFRIDFRQATDDEIRRIAQEQLDHALAEIGDPAMDRHEAIHQVRRRCKKLRGLLRLCRGVLGNRYRRENTRYRDAARRLSGPRDAEALIETYDRLLDRYEGPLERSLFAPVRRRLTLEKQHRTSTSVDFEGEIARLTEALLTGRARLPDWTARVGPPEDLVAGFRKNYRHGRKAMRGALENMTTERFHEWRKPTKYLSHHLRLLEGLWKPVLRAHRKEAERLADLLGREHDLGVLHKHLERNFTDYGNREVINVLFALIHGQRERLRHKAGKLGRRIYAGKPGEIADRLGSLMQL